MRSIQSALVALVLCTSAASSPAAATYTFTNVADNTGPYSSFEVGVAINNAGKLAFRGSLDAGAEGIFTGPDPDADKVIGVGDGLFGSTVTRVVFWRTGLNDNGDVAFNYELADGRSGIAVAAVPEPAGVALLAAAAGAAVLRRRVRRR